MKKISADMAELLKLLNKNKVEYLICGGHAVAHYGFIRMTLDFDILLNPTTKNAEKIMVALNDFGFGSAGIPKEAFLKEGTAVTLGVQPNQVDLLTSISSKKTSGMFKRGVAGEISGIPVKYVALRDLIDAKKESSRNKDRIDLEELLKANNKS
jgi:predicted nucleotidyltransferase